MSEHTREPWRYVDDTGEIHASDGYIVVPRFRTSPDDAVHIVACVNALAGLNPDAVKGLVELAEKLRDALGFQHPLDGPDDTKCEICILLHEADTALAEVKA